MPVDAKDGGVRYVTLARASICKIWRVMQNIARGRMPSDAE
jgi:hypothetical protein